MGRTGSWVGALRGFGATVVALLVLAVTAPLATASGTSPGQVYAFGSNLEGELGYAANNNANPTPTLVSLPGATGPGKLLAVGSEYSLAVTSTNQLFSWGVNDRGQLGYTNNSNPNPTPTLVSLPGASGPPKFVGAGLNYTLALTTTGQLYSFGDNDFAENGYAADSNPHPTPTLVTIPGAIGAIVQAAAGTNSSIALTATGQVFGWGDNNLGAIGNATNDTTDTANPPTQLVFPGEIGPVIDIAEGWDYGLAITSSGQIFTWGDNSRGQLGYPADSTPNPTPFAISLPPGSGQPVKAFAGDSFSLVVTSTGELFAFGDNDRGELGFTANNNPNPSPTRVSLPGEVGGVVSAAAGFNQSLAVTSSGQLFAWGLNFFGELGYAANNNANPTPTLVAFPAGTTVDAVSAGPFAIHTLVLIADLAITNGTLPGGQVASRYTAAPSASGGTPPDTWGASGLPPGLAIDPATGLVSGTPSAAGTYDPVFTVTDADGISVSRAVTMAIAPPPPPVARVTRTSIVGPVTTFTVACSGIAGQVCTGNLVAKTALRQSGSTILAVSASRRRHRSVTVTKAVAHGAYSIPAGATARVRLTLNRVGMRALSRFLRVPTRVTFTGALSTTRSVTFAYPRVIVSVSDQWSWGCTPSGGCSTTVLKLSVTGLPSGAAVTLLCAGGGCPVRERVFKPHRASLALTRLFTAKLRPGGTVTIRVTARNHLGSVTIFTVQSRSIPIARSLCLEPGARAPQACR